MEHVLMLAIVVFVLYHLLGSCGCRGNGFRVGGQRGQRGQRGQPASSHQSHLNCFNALGKKCTQNGGSTCDTCAHDNQILFMKAGCKQPDYTDYCKPIS